MTAGKFRDVSTWFAATFVSMLLLSAATTTHPILI